MIEFIQQYSPITQALFATLFTWGVTAAGASLVFFTKSVKPKLLDTMLGFAAGVMIAASFWSLLAPGLEMAEQLGHTAWLTAAIGFLGGGVFMRLTDRLLPHLHLGEDNNQKEGIKTSWQRSTLLVCWRTRRDRASGSDDTGGVNHLHQILIRKHIGWYPCIHSGYSSSNFCHNLRCNAFMHRLSNLFGQSGSGHFKRYMNHVFYSSSIGDAMRNNNGCIYAQNWSPAIIFEVETIKVFIVDLSSFN